MSQELDEKANEHTPQHFHHHACSNLFGCGDEKGIGVLREDIKERAFNNRASDRLLHMDEIDQAKLDSYLSARGRGRRKFLQASSFMGALAAVGPWFGTLAQADEVDKPASAYQGGGRMHLVPSTKETVQLGVYDTNLPPILTIDSGDSISFPDTWSHFLNELQPGVPIDTLARLRSAAKTAQGFLNQSRAFCRFENQAVGKIAGSSKLSLPPSSMMPGKPSGT
jgi:hypothetical protein